MFAIPSLYLKLAGAAVVALAVGWHFLGDWRVNHKLSEVQAELIATKASLKQAEDNLIQATRDRDTYLQQSEEAARARAKIQSDLNVTLNKLRKQKPPTECKAAIDWAVQNKDDLKWEAK